MPYTKPFKLFKDRSIPFLRENLKLISQFILTLFFIGIGIWFIKNERAEISQVKDVMSAASIEWIIPGIILTVVYLLLQGMMYMASFKAVGSEIPLRVGLILFLKRNFISVFLPAGGISSLAFFTGDIEERGVNKSQIHFASSIYGFVGILSVILVALPVFVIAFLNNTVGAGEWFALASIIGLVSLLAYVYRSIKSRGFIYRSVQKYFPNATFFLDGLINNKLESKGFMLTVLYSSIIEVVGIAHIYIAMLALNLNPSLLTSSMAYIISVIFLIISPFLRGLGAIEVSMAFVITRFGFSEVEAIAVTFLYRFFEFWLPMIAGAFSFLLKINKLLMRVLPAFLLFVLGLINIISVLTPSIAVRVQFLKGIIAPEVISVSNYFVLAAGLFLLITAAFMLKGLRSAWYLALTLSLISFIGNLAKAVDYEESTIALVVTVILFVSRKEYYVRINPRLRNIGIQTTLLSMGAVIIYGTLGFYLLDKRHFNVDFSLIQSIRYTLENYFLIVDDNLVAQSKFGRNFLYSINISGVLSIAFLLYTLIRPYVSKEEPSKEELDKAENLLEKHGHSALDYFKTYFDKLIFHSGDESFISYRVIGNYAVVLEDPVAPDHESMKQCIKAFDQYGYENGLKPIYYRVSEQSMLLYKELGKKALFLGQEGVVDLDNFSLAGGTKKSMRNALKKVSDKGFKATVHTPPLKDGLLQKLKAVSDEWLQDTNRSEIIFSQGMFIWEEIKNQVVITVENEEEKVVAFLNIIPDFVKGEATYDLMRKSSDAPNGIMDFILIELFNYLKSNGDHAINLGFAPLAGLDEAKTFPEKSMKFAYERIRTFSHYKGLREYKDKFEPTWFNKYLIYDNDYDLFQIPSILNKVIKP
ncbi:hypothetical protein ADIARSV_1066 [Arcticibacter svalbardensis MN12-7]|uniref:Phosphatidylglycerol lysyltransferase n=1 Tax=Arcticibacter svalbardensis MN12-7 TaxID=1150600 RepID=R9GVR8_9SPHI|nr:bifunctional lysylphosphatidylglycerol flippase/synthetase MprF [Arcticibacter svalbardensis]EOR95753.1 hypothetical protein ADIARSV_1066 [Arcticibacter svalbardensis MN12-7]